MSDKYYVWCSDTREVQVVSASSETAAAGAVAVGDKVPCDVALRVVPVWKVTSFGIGVYRATKGDAAMEEDA